MWYRTAAILVNNSPEAGVIQGSFPEDVAVVYLTEVGGALLTSTYATGDEVEVCVDGITYTCVLDTENHAVTITGVDADVAVTVINVPGTIGYCQVLCANFLQ